jgi:hypothetical protein
MVDTIKQNKDIVTEIVNLRRMSHWANSVLDGKMVEVEALFHELAISFLGLVDVHPKQTTPGFKNSSSVLLV